MQQKERAVLFGVKLDNDDKFEVSMQELENLANACDIEVVGIMTQNLSVINSATYAGSGKVKEIYDAVRNNDADLVIFDDELTPSQIRNLEKELECKIIDRTVLILDIFAQRAKTKESQLQVEIARYKYMLPRLVGLRASLGRQSGGVGTKNRGAGEKKLELDRRKIEEKITFLNKELEALVQDRQLQRRHRQKTEIPVVSLVGYTNAGKSAIMNQILEMYDGDEEKKVFEKNMLFATLETSVRNIKMSGNKSLLLTDTVGFVGKLPHHLVKAFRSTLEEVKEADLLIHVVDYSNPDYEQQIEVTNRTLKELEADNISMIYAYNKCDLTDIEFPSSAKEAVFMSAKEGKGLDKLIELVEKHIYKDYVKSSFLIPFSKGELVSYFSDNSTVFSTDYTETGTKINVLCKRSDYERYREFITTV